MPGAAPAAAEPAAPTADSRGGASFDFHDTMAAFRHFLDKMDPVNMWILRTAGVAGLLALAYLMLVIFSGQLAKLDTNPNATQIMGNLRIAAMVLNVALILCSVSVLMMMFDEKGAGIGVGALGLGLNFLLPILLFAVAGRSIATAAIIVRLRPAAMALTVLGLTKYAIDLVLWLIALPQRAHQKADVGGNRKVDAAQQKVAKDANMFSPCWKLPYCREVIRKQCPAFLARRTCWKFGRGCYCDEEMISRIIRGESLDVIKSPTRMSTTKAPCGRCYIYLEHQGHKFRMMSPLSLPATIGICYFAAPFYRIGFEKLFSNLDSFWNSLGISDPHALATGALKTDPQNIKDVTAMQPVNVMGVAEVMFGIILGFMLLVYISKFIEWAIFKAKL